MRLSRRLQRWQDAELITNEQRLRILAFEDEGGSSARLLVWAVAAVGGLAIAAGVVSLIAANWEEIPAGVKLFTGVVLLAGTAVAALRLDGRAEGWPRDLLLLLHQLLVLGVIGLVAQVYHLSGAPWRPFVVASALALLPALLATRSVLSDVWIAYTLTAVMLVLHQLDLLEPLFEHNDVAVLPFAAAIGLLLLAAARMRAPWLTPGAPAALDRWASVILAGSIVVGAVTWSISELSRDRDALVTWPWFLLAVAIGAVLASKRIEPLELATGLLGLALIAGPALAQVLPEGSRKWLGFVLAVGFCLALVFAAASEGSRGWVNFGSLMLAARIVMLYFELFENLMNTGLGLLVTGAVLIATAWGWWRLRGLVPMARPPAGGAR